MEGVYTAINKEIDVDKFLLDYQEKLNWIQANDKSRYPCESVDEASIVSQADFHAPHYFSAHLFQDLNLLNHPNDVLIATPDLTKNWSRRDLNSLSVPKPAMSLKCVQERVAGWSKKRPPGAHTKYRTARYLPPSVDSEKPSSDLIEPFSDVLVTLRVMAPLKYYPYANQTLKMEREIVMLGQQYLHEFRDMIVCACDSVGPFVDVSEDPSADVRTEDKYADKTNSGFIFFGDTLFNDMRMEGNLDYSQGVVAWAKEQTEIKELKQAKMEGTRFLDLKRVRLGFPYVYQHFGECQHVIVISDIRVITPVDHRVRSYYPYLQLLHNFRNIVCEICGTHEASHSVTGSTQHIFDPVRLCGKCLSSYHYVDGVKVGEFAVYPFRK